MEAAFIAFNSPEALAHQLAYDVSKRIERGIKRDGDASLVVSGGNTPLSLFGELQHCDVDWKHVHVTLADERWVDPAEPHSNEKLVREHLLNDEMHFVPLKNQAASVEEGIAASEKAIRAMPQPFSACVLGMGEDGHTASLFPMHEQSHASMQEGYTDYCVAINDAPKEPADRISLSKHALLQSRYLAIHILGEQKRNMIEEAMRHYDPDVYPISAFLHQDEVPVCIYWAA